MRNGRAAAIVLAGGSGTRVGGERNKVYLPLAGRSVIAWSLTTFAGMREIGPVVLVIRAADRDVVDRVVDREVEHDGVEIVLGGASRQESELAGLRHLASRIGSGAVDAVLIHDGARPQMSRTLAAGVLEAARPEGPTIVGNCYIHPSAKARRDKGGCCAHVTQPLLTGRAVHAARYRSTPPPRSAPTCLWRPTRASAPACG